MQSFFHSPSYRPPAEYLYEPAPSRLPEVRASESVAPGAQGISRSGNCPRCTRHPEPEGLRSTPAAGRARAAQARAREAADTHLPMMKLPSKTSPLG